MGDESSGAAPELARGTRALPVSFRNSGSAGQHGRAQNLAGFTFGHHLERAAAHLAIRRELLARHARVNGHLGRLPAKRTHNEFANFHAGNLTARRQNVNVQLILTCVEEVVLQSNAYCAATALKKTGLGRLPTLKVAVTEVPVGVTSCD